jgi:hypothetical protein
MIDKNESIINLAFIYLLASGGGASPAQILVTPTRGANLGVLFLFRLLLGCQPFLNNRL